MFKIDVETKRTIDSELTKQLLGISSIRDELMSYTNRFLEKFHTDTYQLFDAIPIHQLCDISVKGGLGIENLEAQLQARAPDILVWNDYIGDCDLNLIIKKDQYPSGKSTGEVMGAVAQRIKILLVETIDETRYSTLLKDLKADKISPPLYRCSQVEVLAHIVDFVSQNIQLPVQIPGVIRGDIADLQPILIMVKDIIPQLVEICGDNLKTVTDIVTTSDSNDWIVYDNRIKENILFVSNLNNVESSWTDVDYSFFPYIPGRMDSLGYEVNELVIKQQRARQIQENPDLRSTDIFQPVTLPYDIFKLAITPFAYTTQDTTNDKINPHKNDLFQPTKTYNLSMYSNNLIDDFCLIRTALRFSGYALRRVDVQAAAPEEQTYQIDVRQGSSKCEFVDVAIPRLASPEWFYCQNRHYYITIPSNPPPNSWAFKICDFDYQVEENVNLLIELGCGLSHSKHKADKRIRRLGETWIRCDFQTVFPRDPNGALPPGINVQFDAPKSLVEALTVDYQNLFGLDLLPDWIYNDVFKALFTLKQEVDTFNNQARATAQQRDVVIRAAKELGKIGLMEIMCMADVVDGPEVTELRELLENGHIKVNWTLATYLLLKASQIPDVIWFPRYGVFEVIDPNAVQASNLQVAEGAINLVANGFVGVMWDAPPPEQALTLFTLPTEDVMVPNAPNPIKFYGKNLIESERQLDNEIRTRLMRANNQMLRVAYGTILNCLLRTSPNAYMSDVLPVG